MNSIKYNKQFYQKIINNYMIRRSRLNIGYSNKNKLDKLDLIFEEAKRVINLYINHIWAEHNFSSKFIDIKVETWFSARMLQALGKQALEIVKSQRKKKKKIKPVFNSSALNLDERFIDIKFDLNSKFDCWIKLGSLGNKIIVKFPSHKHKHFNKFFNSDWNLKKSFRLCKNQSGYFIDLFFEKNKVLKKISGKTIGLDCGYKKLLISSDNKTYDCGLERIYNKISRKKQGSKNFKHALVERNNLINQSINLIKTKDISTIVVEDLKNVKKDSKGKIRKKFNNKLQRWSYLKVLDKLSMICDEEGINFIKVDPAYTSQTCSKCGSVHKESRNGIKYLCIDCGVEIDADYNASLNILHRGIYSSSTDKANFQILQ